MQKYNGVTPEEEYERVVTWADTQSKAGKEPSGSGASMQVRWHGSDQQKDEMGWKKVRKTNISRGGGPKKVKVTGQK